MSHHRGRAFRLRLLGIAAFTLAAAAVFVYFLGLSGVDLVPHASYTLHASASDVVELADHADVLEAGVKVGSVQGIATSGGQAQLTLSLDTPYAPVYRDGQIAIRAKTLLGENYVDLTPGEPASGAVPNGGRLPASAPTPTQLDQILSSFDPRHRRELQQILDVLDTGVGGHGSQLNSFLGGSAQLVENAAPVSAVLATDRRQLASLINDFGTVSSALGARATDIQEFVLAARRASVAITARDAALRATLHALPGFVAQADRAVVHLGSFSLAATPVIHKLRLATDALVPAIKDLEPAAVDGTAIVHQLAPFADVATASARALRHASPTLTALTVPLQAVLRQADPMLAYLVRYSLEMGTIFPSMRAPTEFHDSTAGYGRINTVFAKSLISGASPEVDKLLASLAESGLVSIIDKLQRNPYPRPRADDYPLVPYTGTYPRIEPDPPYKGKR